MGAGEWERGNSIKVVQYKVSCLLSSGKSLQSPGLSFPIGKIYGLGEYSIILTIPFSADFLSFK